jgi:hypothetical protein
MAGDTYYDEMARRKAVERAKAWTAGQSARLDTSPEAILEAVRLDWLPEQIEGVSSKYALECHPPPFEDVPEWMDVLIAKRAKAKV